MFYGLSVPSDCISHMKIKLLMNTFYKKSKPKCCRHKSRGTWGSGEPCRAVSDFNCTATWVNHNTFCCKNLVKCFFQTICFWSVKQCTSNYHQKILILDKLLFLYQNQSKCPRQLLLISSFVHGRFLDKQRSRATKVEEVRCCDDFYDDEVASVSFLYNLEC